MKYSLASFQKFFLFFPIMPHVMQHLPGDSFCYWQSMEGAATSPCIATSSCSTSNVTWVVLCVVAHWEVLQHFAITSPLEEVSLLTCWPVVADNNQPGAAIGKFCAWQCIDRGAKALHRLISKGVGSRSCIRKESEKFIKSIFCLRMQKGCVAATLKLWVMEGPHLPLHAEGVLDIVIVMSNNLWCHLPLHWTTINLWCNLPLHWEFSPPLIVHVHFFHPRTSWKIYKTYFLSLDMEDATLKPAAT